MLKKLLSRLSVFVLITVCFSIVFSSCSTGEPTVNTEEQTENTILTNIFSEKTYTAPENFRMLSTVLPYYDETNRTVSVFGLSTAEVQAEDNSITEKQTGWLYTYTLEGEILETEEILLPEDIGYIAGGVITDNTLLFMQSTVYATVLYSVDRETDETRQTEEGKAFFGNNNFTCAFVTTDMDGQIYCTDRNTLYVLAPDLSLIYSLEFPTSIYTMARGADDEIWVTFNAGMESCAAKIDNEVRTLGAYYSFPGEPDSLVKKQHHLLDAAIIEEAYNFYYYDADILYGVTITENGSLVEEPVANLYNSGINLSNRNDIANGKEGDYATAVLSHDLLLITRYKNSKHCFPVFHFKTDDIDLNNIQTVTIAHAYALDADIVAKITQYNKKHPDTRIVIQDYSKYVTRENPTAGEEKLCFDMINGIIQPDIVVTHGIEKTIADNSVMNQLCRNQLYVDLKPYLEKDDTVNFDTLFGCIPRLYDDGNGGMWGISTDFTISTLIGSPTLLGEYADKGYWNLEEMFDFFDSLPADTEKYFRFTHALPNWQLMGQGYNLFINDTECTFTSGTFTRYLEFLNSVPTTVTEWKTLSSYANLTSEEQIAALHAGKVGLEFLYISQAVAYDAFKAIVSGEIIPIGYATKTDTGTRINANHVYSITTFAEDADLCFEIVKSFFTVEEFRLSDYGNWPIFALKSQFEQAMRTYGSVFRDSMLSQGELGELYNFLDNIGIPLTLETPSAIDEIVEEEISAYLAGVGTADDCARKIQSRVEIWLAEHE